MPITRPKDSTIRDESVPAESGAKWYVAFAAVILFAAALRMYNITAESLWIDEGYSLRDATTPYTIAKASKPLYYWILSWWIHLGQNDLLLRFPAVIFGVACVAVTFLLGKLLWGTRAAFAAGVLASVSPLQVNHSQEVRMYTLLTLMVLCSAYFLVLSMKTWKIRHMLICAFFSWLAILTHPMASFMLVPQSLVMLDSSIRTKRSLVPWIISQVLVIIAWLPWVPEVLGFGKYYDKTWNSTIETPSLSSLPILWGQFGLGEWDQRFGSSLMHKTLYVYTYGSLLLVALFVWIDRRKIETRFLFLWFVLPTVILFLLSLLKMNAWVTRYLIFSSPAFYLLLAALWLRPKSKIFFAVCGVLFVLIPMGKLVRYYQKPMRPDWRQVAHYVTVNQHLSDVIGVYRRQNMFVFEHYYRGRARWVPIGPKDLWRSELEGWNETRAHNLIKTIPHAPRKWLIVSMVPMAAEQAIDSAIRKHYQIIDYRRFQSFTPVTVYLFREPAGK